MKWLTTYNDWSAKVGHQFSDWLFEYCLKIDAVAKNYIPAIGMTLVIAFVAFVVFLFAVGAVKFP